jgi:hypothetical protein
MFIPEYPLAHAPSNPDLGKWELFCLLWPNLHASFLCATLLYSYLARPNLALFAAGVFSGGT